MTANTLCQLGYWQQTNDTFVAHPYSPTNAILDLNDGATFAILDTTGKGGGLNVGNVPPEVLKTSNPRVPGEIPTRILHRQNRKISVKLVAGQFVTYAAYIAAIRNLQQLCVAITPNLPAALKVQPSGSSTSCYFDVVQASVVTPYEELQTIQLLNDGIDVEFDCLPYIRGTRQWLQNLAVNPGFEAPSGPGVAVFNESFANTNAYTLNVQAYRQAVMADSPTRLYLLNDPAGNAGVAEATGSGSSGTAVGGVTLGVTGIISNDADTAASLNGTTGTIIIPVSGLPNSNANWTLEAVIKLSSTLAAQANILTIGTFGTNKGCGYIALNSSRGLIAGASTGTDTTPSTALATGTVHHVAAAYNGATILCYLDGALVNSIAVSSMAVTTVPANLGSSTGSANWFPGVVQAAAIFSANLSAARLATHAAIALGTASAGALSTDKTYYSDIIKTDTPSRYYRFDEASGTVATDASNGQQNATYAGTTTFGVPGALTGDTDTAVTFAAANSNRLIIPTTGLPTANGAISVDGWLKFAANPASSQYIFDYGAGTVANHNNLELFIDTAGKLNAAVGSTAVITTAAALTTGVYHYCALTWDGTTLSLYVDTAAALTATPGAQTIPTSSINCYIGAKNGGISFYSGQLDDWAIYGTALSAARVAAHYTAATTTPAASATTILIPADTNITFGNAAWSAVNQWQIRFRYQAGLTVQALLHATDANDWTGVQMQSGTANGFACLSVGNSITTSLATATVTLVPGVLYWLQLTQFPQIVASAALATPYIQAILAVDTNGSVGSTIATLTGQLTVGVSGKLQLCSNASALGIWIHNVSLFGPGGWWFTNAGTGIATGAWQQNSANTYSGGPISSVGAAVISPGATGSLDAYWTTYNPTATATVTATAYGLWPVGTTNHTFQASVYLNSTGLVGASCTQSLRVVEFDSSGNQLRSTTLQSVTGNQSWTKLSGSLTTGANTLYLGLQIRAVDATNASANGVITVDNCSWWDQTQTGMLTMPYCELRFPQAPAQLVISGVMGDIPAPAQLLLGIYMSFFILSRSVVITCQLARRPIAVTSPQLVWGAGYAGSIPSGQSMVLDTSAWGGCYHKTPTGGNNTGLSTDSATLQSWNGQFHVLARAQITGATTPSAIGLNMAFSQPNGTSPSSTIYPFSANSSWTIGDTGYSVPVGGLVSGLNNLTRNLVAAAPQVNGLVSFFLTNYLAFLPVDGEMIIVSLKSTSTGSGGGWSNFLHDGLSGTVTYMSIITSSNDTFLLDYFAPVGGGSTFQTVQSLAASRMYVDPALVGANATHGVNQFVMTATDDQYDILGCALDVIYSPCYLQML